VKGDGGDKGVSADVNYANLWQHNSQGITARNSVQLDYLVGRRALENGQSRKAIALMLAASSSVVQQIHRSYGKKRAMDYVNQTVRSICQQQLEPSAITQSLRRQLELE